VTIKDKNVSFTLNVSNSSSVKTLSQSAGQRSLKILLWTNAFDPMVGGLETFARMLGEEFTGQGHQVTVITRTPAPPSYKNRFPFKVVRQPSWFQLLRLVRDCDVYLQNHLSLKAAWPLLLVRRPWVVGIHNWLSQSGMRGALQPFFLRHAHNICCSRAIAAAVQAPSIVVPGAYDDSTFKETWHGARDRELMFVGRLVSDKGLQVILQALCLLRAEGLYPRLTVVGTGPHEDAFRRVADQVALTDQVEFVGKKATNQEVADLLNLHQILIVPSLWQEPFGAVALEGIACGCVVVGSEGGGLKDAIGPCGVTFPNGNAGALADCLANLLREPSKYQQYRRGAAEHLARHTKKVVASSYLNVIQAAV
jgi:glycogen(starch) synthase